MWPGDENTKAELISGSSEKQKNTCKTSNLSYFSSICLSDLETTQKLRIEMFLV